MAKKNAGANPQQTYTMEELQEGTIYRDALSGYLVLVRVVTVYEVRRGQYPGGGWWSRTEPVKRTVGWYWNPVFGRHEEMQLHDHQLIRAEADTAMLPDTRAKNGHHGA